MFGSDRDGNSEIYVMDADGSDPVRITDSPLQEVMAAWSPDGTRIAYRQGPAVNILVAYRDGTGIVDITDSGDVLDRFPHWSHGPAGFGGGASGSSGSLLAGHRHR